MYMEENPAIVDKYVMQKISLKQIRKWIHIKVNGGRERTKQDYVDSKKKFSGH